ncbi:hypothetical protein AB6A40_004845 [Gnathostoma spinigerum]|uniref:5-oxoprolinase n=1 Tax=Gnathostoma spinigerum TaxID=75299 RepID=A0ABD6EG17_9BILA
MVFEKKVGYGFAIDRGGTFTDVYVRRPDGSSRILKLLSEDPANYVDAPTEAIRRVLQDELGIVIPRDAKIPTEQISWIRMGTTIATNALLERRGERTALLITEGFKDLLFIGDQTRPRIFDFDIKVPDLLYEKVVEVEERVLTFDESDQTQNDYKKVLTRDKEWVLIAKEVNTEQLMSDLNELKKTGIRSLAVAFLHSFRYPNHEEVVGRIAKDMGFQNVSLSSDVMPMIKIVPRAFTACADSYLTPKIQEYIRNFRNGFVDCLSNVNVLFMQSDGGLCSFERFCGSRSILSGPAAGVVGISLTSYDERSKQPIIGFDMGGTSTDVSRYAGDFVHVMETTTAGVTIQAPQLDINTVAAGGGSRLFFRGGLMAVGPESAGADPGPVCYRKGGYLTITDANVILRRIIPDLFPHIFGPNEDEPIDREAAIQALSDVAKDLNNFFTSQNPEYEPLSLEEIALGFIDVANESMCRPIRALTQSRGFDTSAHVLACFGGAGGQHACAIARTLGMKEVYVHKYSGVLSAYGLALADVVQEAQEPCGKTYDEENFSYFFNRLYELRMRCKNDLQKMDFSEKDIRFENYLHMRYERTDCALMCESKSISVEDIRSFGEVFIDSYLKEFGYTMRGRSIIVDNIRVRGVGKTGLSKCSRMVQSTAQKPVSSKSTECYFKGGYQTTLCYHWRDLSFGHTIEGPSIIYDRYSTILIEPGCTAVVTEDGNLRIHVGSAVQKLIGTDVDPIQLSIFSHRFMSIAEQMGRTLRRTAVSTNIKERLDFSCALFGADGGLVANAPHIPVHLGGMQATVRFQIEHCGVGGLNPGDVILCNHPKAGGSHLPDLTVITPIVIAKPVPAGGDSSLKL